MAAPRNKTYSRRTALKTLGTTGTALAAFAATSAPAAESKPSRPKAAARANDAQQVLTELIFKTPLVDTHEHLIEEKERLQGAKPPRVPCDDWAMLFSHYLNSDLLTAGMPKDDLQRFLSPDIDPRTKWRLLAPHWPAVKNTGYAQAVRIAMEQLYEVPDLNADSVMKAQAGYERTRRPGFYERVLREEARIESCQVNSLTGEAFTESAQPTLLMQDLSIVGMFAGPNFKQYAPASGITVQSLADWHRVIDWWFEHYAPFAVAVKSQHAYSRDIDYVRTPPERAEPVFRKVREQQPVTPGERRVLEDHLFWYAVDQATRHNLPVKLHTGYYAGQDSMPLGRLAMNAISATELCRQSPDTRFVFMHMAYPFYEDLLSVIKHWTHAHVDMCWAWIINPIAAKDYLKKHIVTAPVNKLLPFGGDYIPVEPVLGHAVMARRGIALALTELVREGWLTLNDAVELVEPILNGNARRLFNLPSKTEALKRKATQGR